MDLIGDILHDFVNRSRDELTLVEEGLTEWQAGSGDPSRLAYLAELLQSLQEMSGLLALPDLECAFGRGHKLLRAVQQDGPNPSHERLGSLKSQLQSCRQLLLALETNSVEPDPASPTSEAATGLQSASTPTGGLPSPFRQSAALRGPANSLTDFIVENLATADDSTDTASPRMGARLVQLIDEVMASRNQIRQMFAHAVGLKSDWERSAFLDRACPTCPELRASLERILKSESQSHRLLQFPASELIRALLDSLRSEMLCPTPRAPSAVLTVPEEDIAPDDLESTVHVHNQHSLVEATNNAPSDPTTLPRPFGRYTLELQLGQGAMGMVYLASDRLLNRQVALKLLRVEAQEKTDIVERFYREARSMASLQHANLCPIYDFGEVDGQPYLTMAYIKGRPLSEYLVGGRPLVTRYAVKLARTLAIALHHAHQNNIVHRDLKPANVMINKDGEPVLMDFGLARSQQSREVEITQQGVILGSPAYMAPEQVEGKIDQIGPATDVHALGVILYEMLSGRKPFDGTVASVLAQIQSKQPDLLDVPGDSSGRLNAICQRAMSKAIADRYATTLEFADDLTAFLETAEQVSTATIQAASADPYKISQTESSPAPEPRKRWWLKWAVASVFGGVATAALRETPPEPETTFARRVGLAGTQDQTRQDNPPPRTDL